MGLENLKAPRGARHKKKRVGRGTGSGQGGTAGRGHKGARSRSGNTLKRGFEGGQMPLQRRLPKRGFKNISRVEFVPVGLARLDTFEAGSVVDGSALCKAGIISRVSDPVKILANGELKKALTVQVQAFSKIAKEKIEAAGGKALVVPVKRKRSTDSQEG